MRKNGHTCMEGGAKGSTSRKSEYGGVCMSKMNKNRKARVPKLTEAEYIAYVASLQGLETEPKKSVNADMGASFQKITEKKEE